MLKFLHIVLNISLLVQLGTRFEEGTELKMPNYVRIINNTNLDTYLSMNCEDTVIFIMQDFNVRCSVITHTNGLPGTDLSRLGTRDNVTVGARRETGLKRDRSIQVS
jgi:hypothetical protein